MKRIIKYLLVFTLLFAANKSFAQWRLVMEFVVTDEGKKLAGSEVKVYKNGSLVETILTDAKGRADVAMDPDGEYVLEVGGNKGFIKKKIAVSTKNVPPEAAKGDVFYPAEVEIFSKIDGLNMAILEKPIGKIEYSTEDGYFGADREYTKQVQKDLAELKENYLKEKEKEAANQKVKQKEYDDAIKVADKAFAAEKWEEAEAAYKKAAAAMPIETYPSFQLAELETKLIKIRETNQKYQEAITKADAAYASKDYEIAIGMFKKATELKPDESYPKEKLSEVQGLLANQAKTEQTYLSAIERGDNALKVNDLQSAKDAFTEASTVKPSESYPKNKLAEINDILGKEAAKEEEYQAAIRAGDESLAAKDFVAAKASYQKASTSKPNENYPKDQLAKLDGLMAAAAKQEQDYLAAIEKADNALAANKFDEAKAGYKEASGVKPAEEYPKNKILEVDALLAKREASDKAYQEKIAAADKSLDAKEYDLAKTAYAAAAELKPAETYPKEKIKEIEGILAQQEQLEQNYKASILKADQDLENARYDEAKAAYNEAIALKPNEAYPKDKLAEIETIVLKHQAAEEDYKKAIQNGDDALAAKDFEKSSQFYQEALELKSDEQYPKDKLAEIEKLKSEAAELETNYAAAIAEGDAAFKAKDLEKAKTAFTKASGLKPEESYPKEQLTAIDGQLAASKQLEADYKAAIADADAANEAGDYKAAKDLYEKALAIKTQEAYPQSKISEIEALIAANAKKDEVYNTAIGKADKALENEKLEEAKAAYEEALSIKTDDYPKGKITEIDAKLEALAAKAAASAKVDADYQAAIAEGDQALSTKDYEKALLAFTAASELKAEESYPREKITAIKDEQAKIAAEKAASEKLAAVEKEYADLISKADKSFQAEEFESARTAYQSALALKSEESYPKEKIEEINAKLSDAAAQDELYAAAISSADKLLASEDLEAAKEKYNEALSIKSAEQYPKDKLAEIDTKLADIAAKQEAIRLSNAKAEEQEAKYNGIIAEADKLLAAKNYTEAKSKYLAALEVKEDAYPKDKLSEIDAALAAIALEKEKESAAAEQAKIEVKYLGIVAEADELLETKKYQEAKLKYQEALAVKDDEYPKSKVDEIDELIAAAENSKAAKEQAKKDAEYMALITDADNLFSEHRYEKAQTKYEEALGIKEDSHPANQLAEIERLLKEQAERDAKAAQESKIEADYDLAIQQADDALANDQFEDALSFYKKAAGLKPNETYPPNKISQIEDILANSQISEAAQRAMIESKYMESITLADIAMLEEDYVDAKEYFKNAKALKPNEAYPQRKLDELEQLLAKEDDGDDELKLQQEREAKNELAYQTAIATADKLFANKKYNEAENEYELAMGIKPSETYPQSQIDRINQLKADAAAAKLLAEQEKNKAANEDAKYQEYIASGDQALESKSYRSAKSAYQSALGLKPNEAYPTNKINAIDKLLEEEQLALEQKRKEEEKPIVIQKGPKATVSGDAEAEIEKRYQEMWAKKNEDKNKLIEEKELAVKETSDANREAELKKRENAIQRIENISISLMEQESMAKEYNMQNYEKVKQKTDDLQEEETELKRNSERKRNDDYADAEDKEKGIRDNQRELSENLMEGRKDGVEDEYASLMATAQTNAKEQTERTKNAEDKYLMKEEEMAEFNKEKSASNLHKNTDALIQKEEDLKETTAEYQSEQDKRIERTNQEKVVQEQEIYLYNKKLATENLNSNTSRINKVQDDWKETNDTYKKEASERTSNEQQNVNNKQVEIQKFQRDNGEHFKDNQQAVEEKEKILQEENKRLDSDSEERRQANSDREFYVGEDLPRLDAEAADLPQGVSEEIIENKNNSTTIRRTVVNGTEVDVYEKTFFPWGGVFYTKNGNNITEESWDTNSR